MTDGPHILGIETSCDETACALVDRQGRVRINAVASQMELHAQFGGVVPEVASRRHIETCLPMVRSVLAEAAVAPEDLAGIAVTHGPGLIGCLLMGVETAKALAWRHGKPLYAVHHLQAHLYAPMLRLPGPDQAHVLIEKGHPTLVVPIAESGESNGGGLPIRRPDYPHLGLVVSGGHTSMVLVESPGVSRPIAATRDDAAGEAYDKVARLLGLGYPGGPEIDRLAATGQPGRFAFTPPLRRKDQLDFSFSGLKSAVARKVEAIGAEGLDEKTVRDLCAGFQTVVIGVLLSKAVRAARKTGVRDLLIVGGVASNRGLRRAAAGLDSPGLRIWFPHASLCTDNAAMIAGLAWRLKPLDPVRALALNPEASPPFPGAPKEESS